MPPGTVASKLDARWFSVCPKSMQQEKRTAIYKSDAGARWHSNFEAYDKFCRWRMINELWLGLGSAVCRQIMHWRFQPTASSDRRSCVQFAIEVDRLELMKILLEPKPSLACLGTGYPLPSRHADILIILCFVLRMATLLKLCRQSDHRCLPHPEKKGRNGVSILLLFREGQLLLFTDLPPPFVLLGCNWERMSCYSPCGYFFKDQQLLFADAPQGSNGHSCQCCSNEQLTTLAIYTLIK